MLSTIRSSNSIRPSYSAATVRQLSRNRPSRQLHDVGLVDGRDLAPAVGDGVVEGVAGDPLRRCPGDDLDALRRVRADHVLDAGVEVLGVLADDHEVDVLVAGLEALHRARRAEVRVQPERLAERDVDAPEARRRPGVVIGPFRATRLRRIDSRTASGSGVPCSAISLAGLLDLPLEGHARRIEHAPGRLRQLRTDAVAGDQGDAVGHGRDCTDGAGRPTGRLTGGRAGRPCGSSPRISPALAAGLANSAAEPALDREARPSPRQRPAR